MQLSIYNVYENISDKECYLSTEETIAFDLNEVRIYTSISTTLSNDILYILHPEQLMQIPPNPSLHFLCLGTIDTAYIKNKFQSVIVMPLFSDFFEVLSKVQDIFKQYNEWKDAIHQAILQKETLQTIFDLCGSFFKNPLALFDSSQSLMMKAGNIPKDTRGSLWGVVLKKGHSPIAPLEESSFLNTQLQSNPLPFYYHSNDKYRNNNRLIAGIHLHNAFFGCIGLTDINSPISNLEYSNLHLVQNFMSMALLNSKEYEVYLSKTPWYINKLLRGEQVEKGILAYNLSLKKLQMEDRFYLWCFRPVDSSLKDSFGSRHYITNFSRYFQTAHVFEYENQIIVLEYRLNSYDDQNHLLNLGEFLSMVGFIGAYSMIFNRIQELSNAYMQCQISLDNIDHDQTNILCFQTHYSSYIFELIKMNAPSNGILYPCINQLLINDKKYGMDLLECLKAYIMHGRNASTAANQLFVHRHTVIYRLNHISKIMDIDLKSLNDDALFHLFLSCCLLIHSEKTSIQD